jgi:hypothetical protein
MAREKLGDVRKALLDRYSRVSEEVRNYTMPDLITNKIERTIWGFLNEFGIDYPIDFDRPPPDVYVPARQGTKCLDPFGSTDGMSPPMKTDEACLTWKSRDNGFLVVDTLDFIMEDPIAEDFFTIEYKFDEQVNNANFQKNFSVPEMGHWKFNRIVLVDGEVLTVCVRNTNAFAGGCFSLESRSWSL